MIEALRMVDLEQNGVVIESKLINETPFQTHTYKGELKQVFVSIINNAVDALKEHLISEQNIFLSIKYDRDTKEQKQEGDLKCRNKKK